MERYSAFACGATAEEATAAVEVPAEPGDKVILHQLRDDVRITELLIAPEAVVAAEHSCHIINMKTKCIADLKTSHSQ